MSNGGQDNIRDLDRAHSWHPFTPTDEWFDPSFEIPVIVGGEGSYLIDDKGRKFIDGNSSIWVNMHGHRHPAISDAIKAQLDRIAHSSFLGFTNDIAPRLAARLVKFASPDLHLKRCFFSDDGATSIESGLKIICQYFQQNGQPQRTRFLSLGSAYHGDTVGAMSLGHSETFHKTYKSIIFKSGETLPPACYRCPFNKANPEKADARSYRKCQWECVRELERKIGENPQELAAFIMEPRVQGAAGVFMHPEGYLEKAQKLCHAAGGKFMLDEVMTGFGRTGAFFAFHKEACKPDVIAVAKGLTGGYLPLAATLVTEELFDGFRGGIEKTFYHGHSYTGNQLGSAAALANLDIFEEPSFLPRLQKLSQSMRELSQKFWHHPHVGDVRQEGFILGIELVEDFASRKPFDPTRRIGHRVCEAARKYGLMTRTVGNVLMLIPPYCLTENQLEEAIDALYRGLNEVLP